MEMRNKYVEGARTAGEFILSLQARRLNHIPGGAPPCDREYGDDSLNTAPARETIAPLCGGADGIIASGG